MFSGFAHDPVEPLRRPGNARQRTIAVEAPHSGNREFPGKRANMEETPEHFGFLLLPGFPLAPLASAVDVLALANYVSGRPLFAWTTFADAETAVEAMNGFRFLVDRTMAEAPDLSVITVCCGIGGSRHESRTIQGWLRNRYVRGAKIGSISTGSWLLAQAGLLDGRRCTIHWEDLHAFRETFPKIRATSEIFEIDSRIFTCSGGTAATDMFLSFVAARHGIALATAVAEQLVHGAARAEHTNQRLRLSERSGITNPMLVGAIELMEIHIEEPLKQNDVAGRLGVSGRHLERLFRKHLGRTPQLHYRDLRLRHARSLLRTTNLSILEVACASGFCASSYFAKCYLDQFGKLPGEERASSKLGSVQVP